MSKNIQLAIGTEKGKVIIKLNQNVDLIELDPQNAVDIAEAMARSAYECRFGAAPQKALYTWKIEQIRDKLITRVALMLNSLEKKTNGQKAMHIVDVCLREIL